MNDIEKPITRRQAVTGVVAAGMSLPGCSFVSNGFGSDSTLSTNSTTNTTNHSRNEGPQQHEISDPLDAAETYLKATFEMLNKITVIEDDEIIYVNTGQDPDFLDIHAKFDEVEVALEAASDEYDSDTERFTKLELGADLAEQKLATYYTLDVIENNTLLYTGAVRFVELNGAMGAIDELFKHVESITELAYLSLDTIELFETHGIAPPAYYQINRIATESAVFSDFEDFMTPWLNGLQEWPEALLWGSNGTRGIGLESAIESYANAVDHVTAAQAYFDKRDGRPPVYREPVSHATCQLPTLLETYRTAKMALEHRHDGNEEAARQLLEKANRLADRYRAECYPGNAALVPSIE